MRIALIILLILVTVWLTGCEEAYVNPYPPGTPEYTLFEQQKQIEQLQKELNRLQWDQSQLKHRQQLYEWDRSKETLDRAYGYRY
jgi:hypothetical protein